MEANVLDILPAKGEPSARAIKPLARPRQSSHLQIYFVSVMRVLIVLLPIVAVCFAGDAPYRPEAQRGLLVLPKQGPAGETSVAPRYNNQQGASSNYNQQQQTPEILSPQFAERRGVYFVEVPQERIQALQSRYQQLSQKNGYYQDTAPNQYNQQPGQERFSSQYREEQPVVRYLPIQLTEDSSQPASYSSQPASYSSQPASYSSQYRQQQGEPSGYLASVQYSQVEPIQGPVYSYKPEGLTRILRYAPVF